MIIKSYIFLGIRGSKIALILLQQILSYFLVPLVIAGPLAFALSTALLGYFENFANTSISIDITYLGVAVLLFVLYFASDLQSKLANY